MNYENIIELMIKHLDEGVIIVDSNLNIVYFNEQSTSITGFNLEKAAGKNFFQVFPNIELDNSTFCRAINSGEQTIDYVQNYINYNGKNVSILTTTIPIIENGRVQGAIEIFKDLTQVKNLSDEMIILQSRLYKKDIMENKFLKNGTQYDFTDVISNDSAMIKLKERAKMVGNSSSPIFVFGETGTGKELVVQGIHNTSNRRNEPFIAQNCGALPKNLLESILFGTVKGSFTGAKDKPGLFELADGGTLFLDELNSMGLELQSKLLRVIEDGVIRRLGSVKTQHVDVRIIAASNIELRELVEKKQLREDLFYRLNVIYFRIPPLRERKNDIPMLVEYFINNCNNKMNKSIKGVDQQVMKYFLQNDWPGNVRELENIIESVMNFVEGEYISLEDLRNNTFLFMNKDKDKNKDKFLDSSILKDVGLKDCVEEYEKDLIKSALDESGQNYAEAARILKMPRQTLHGKIKRYEL